MELTTFQWCRKNGVKIKNYEKRYDSYAKKFDFYKQKIGLYDFIEIMVKYGYETDVFIVKESEFVEFRMYGMVPYNLSPIQQGIQFGHAVVEYREKISWDEYHLKNYKQWAANDKTFIILNGGTTSNNKNKLGTLNLASIHVREMFGTIATFYEEDLNDALTAFVFLVDEMVYDNFTYSYEGPMDLDLKKVYLGTFPKKTIEFGKYLKTFKLA